MQYYKSKLKILEIPGGGYHLLINCKLNNQKAILLIDTGASNSIFDKDSDLFANIEFEAVSTENKGSGFNAEISEIHYGEIESLKIGHLEIKNMVFLFTSMNHVNDLYKNYKFPRISGILGCDFLIKQKSIIDLEQEIIFMRKT